MRKKTSMLAVVLTVGILAVLSSSCAQTTADAETSAGDYEALSRRIEQLEKQVKNLELGLDERVIEYNMVQSALYRMAIDNKLGQHIPGNIWPSTNDMREFPTSIAPLYGYDKDGDGNPDTNYVPFEKTTWFYEANSSIDSPIRQFPDRALVQEPPKKPSPTESYATEFHNIQTAVMGMLADSKAGILDATLASIDDLDLVTSDGGALVLSRYIAGLNADGTVKSGCTYTFTQDGTITQTTP